MGSQPSPPASIVVKTYIYRVLTHPRKYGTDKAYNEAKMRTSQKQCVETFGDPCIDHIAPRLCFIPIHFARVITPALPENVLSAYPRIHLKLISVIGYYLNMTTFHHDLMPVPLIPSVVRVFDKLWRSLAVRPSS